MEEKEKTTKDTPSHTPATSHSRRIPILLLITLPVSMSGIFIIAMQLLSPVFYEDPSVTHSSKAIIDTLDIIYVILALAILPCFIAGIVLLSKHLINPSSAAPTQQNNSMSSLRPSKTKDTILLTLSLIFLWLIVPFGFYVVYLATMIAKAMNGSGCEQNPSADHCQPSYLWLYFIVYIIVGFIATKSILFKKLR